jgi:hypothetical protein
MSRTINLVAFAVVTMLAVCSAALLLTAMLHTIQVLP